MATIMTRIFMVEDLLTKDLTTDKINGIVITGLKEVVFTTRPIVGKPLPLQFLRDHRGVLLKKGRQWPIETMFGEAGLLKIWMCLIWLKVDADRITKKPSEKANQKSSGLGAM